LSTASSQFIRNTLVEQKHICSKLR